MLSAAVQQIFTENGGVLRLKDAPDFGVSKETIRKMFHQGDLDKIHAGVYVLADGNFDDWVLPQRVYPKGIISHESAARLHGLIRFTPSEMILSFPHGYKLIRDSKIQISPYFVSLEQYETGVEQVGTWEGNFVKAYNQEKTLVDLARSRYTLPLIFEEAVQGYCAFGTKDFERLLTYAEEFGVKEKLEKAIPDISRYFPTAEIFEKYSNLCYNEK